MRPTFLTVAIVVLFNCALLSAQTNGAEFVSAATPSVSSTSAPISPARLAKIMELLTATGTKAELDKTIAQGQKKLKFYATVQASTLDQAPKGQTKEQQLKEQQLTTDYTANMNKIADTQLTWDGIKNPVIRYCADNFSDAEMDSIIAFYQSPAGKAMLGKGPGLNRITFDSLESLKNKLTPQTQAATKDFKDKINALRGSKNPNASTQTATPTGGN